MLSLIIYWVMASLTLLFIANVISGITISSFPVAFAASLLLGILNILVKPLILLLTLPVNILTMGLFSLITNAAVFALAAWIIPGFEIQNFLAALTGALLLAILSGFASFFIGNNYSLTR